MQFKHHYYITHYAICVKLPIHYTIYLDLASDTVLKMLIFFKWGWEHSARWRIEFLLDGVGLGHDLLFLGFRFNCKQEIQSEFQKTHTTLMIWLTHLWPQTKDLTLCSKIDWQRNNRLSIVWSWWLNKLLLSHLCGVMVLRSVAHCTLMASSWYRLSGLSDLLFQCRLVFCPHLWEMIWLLWKHV